MANFIYFAYPFFLQLGFSFVCQLFFHDSLELLPVNLAATILVSLLKIGNELITMRFFQFWSAEIILDGMFLVALS